MNLGKLKKIIKKNCKQIVHALWLCLNWVENQPNDAPIIGCFWFTDKIFKINVRIFCNFIGKKSNTAYKNLRRHNFTHKKETGFSFPNKFNIQNIHDVKRWEMYSCDKFNKNTTESEAINLPYYEKRKKKGKKKGKNKSKNIGNKYTDLPII